MNQTLSLCYFVLFSLLTACGGHAAPLPENLDLSSRLEAEFAISRAANRLLELQADDGTWSNHPGITALAVIALHKMPKSGNPLVDRALATALPALRRFADAAPTAVNRDTTHVYSCAATHLALLSVSTAPEDLKRSQALAGYLEDFLQRRLGSAALLARGGVVDMPDVSNLHWTIDSVLLTQGDQVSEQLINKIRRFLESCQATEGAAKGGFAYAPIRDGVDRPVWGSLTWAAVRALLLTGYEPDDTVIRDGCNWLQANFSATQNPGLKRGGYYYYAYLTAGTNLLLESHEVTAVPEDWRQQLVDQLLSSQNGDGSWTNSSAVWLENRKPLATAYAILVLSMALQ